MSDETTSPAPERTELDRFFRPVLDVALAFVRERAAEDGPTSAPSRLRPFLRVARLPGAAFTATRLALEEDAELRAAVADRVSVEDVGQGPWLWVSRPEGWREELEGEWAVWEEDQQRASADATEQSSARRLQRAVDSAQRLAGRVSDLESALESTERELARVRAEAEQCAAERDENAAELRRRVDERAEAVRQLKRTEDLLATRTAQLREVEDLLAEEPAVLDPAPAAEGTAALDALRNVVAQLDPLHRSLARLADSLGVNLGSLGVNVAGASGGSGASAPPRRRAYRIGRGIDASSTAAAEVLLGLPGAVAIVDGYNVTMTVWPSLSGADQRMILERCAASLAARSGAEMHLVFDGEGAGGAPARSTDSAVRVRFTSGEVEADDEILDLIATFPLDRPVVVVSDDRRVQRGARNRGANVIGSRQLQPLLLR